jgi:hypothetical protein
MGTSRSIGMEMSNYKQIGVQDKLVANGIIEKLNAKVAA